MKKIFFCTLMVLFTLNINAQSPESFKYQAVVRDGSGNVLANQNVGLQIKILETSATGTVVYNETHTETTNAFGLVNLEIGTGTVVTGVFADIDWSGDLHFIEVGVDPTGGTTYTITGTSQLLSVPYALQAKRAQWQNTADGIAYTGTGVGIGTSTTDITDDTILEVRAETAGDTMNLRLINDEDTAVTRMAFTNNITVTDSNNLVLGINNATAAFGPNEAFMWYFGNFDMKFGTNSTERLRIKNTGNIHVTTGDVYIQDVTKGVLMKSPDGTCYRMTVANGGSAVFTAIAASNCP